MSGTRRSVAAMTRTDYYVAQSLDGYIADADGGIEWLTGFPFPEADGAFFEEFMGRVGALAMGASTYDFIVAEDAPWPYGDRPTWVFTTREGLPVVDGGDVRFVRGAVTDHLQAMRESAGAGALWVVGGGDLASQFVDAGALDRVTTCVMPVWLGAGIPLFARALPAPLRLLRAETFVSGPVLLRYAVPGAEAAGSGAR